MKKYIDFGLELTVTLEEPEKSEIMFGGRSDDLTWDEYLQEVVKEDYHPHFMLIKQAIEQLGWVGETGESKAHYWFAFSDGTAMGFSWGAWGDLMQAIVGKREGYMKYYM